MNPVTAIVSAIRNIHRLRSRAPRREYWWVVLTLILGVCLAAFIDSVEFETGTLLDVVQQIVQGFLIGVYILWLVLYVSVTVRRLRDMDMNAWTLLIFLTPFGLGIVIMAIICSFKGTAGPNQYGPDPLYMDLYSDVDVFG